MKNQKPKDAKPLIASSEIDDSIIDVEVVKTDKRRRDRRQDTSSLKTPTTSTENALVSKDPLALYLAEVRKYPLLTPDEERNLAIRYRETGDPEAAQRLVTANLRFVIKIAAEYSKFGAKMIDLIQEGNIGLMQAVRDFNPYKNVRLITYAVWWIRGHIREYLMRQYSVVRLGTTHNQRKLFYNLQQQENKLDVLGKDVDIPLLSSRLGVKEDEIHSMKQRLTGRDVSLDQALTDDSTTSLLDLQQPDDTTRVDDRMAHQEDLNALKQKIEVIRPSLNKKEQMILDQRLLADEPLTLQEIGDQLGITRERARQLEARILNRLREQFTLR